VSARAREERVLAAEGGSPRNLGRYLILCGAVFLLLLARSRGTDWRGDFWIYAATIEEVAGHPLHPRNPIFGNDDAFAFFSPYTWGLGLVERVTGLRPYDVLVTQGLVNLVLLLGALWAFVTTWLRRPAAAFYTLLFVLFLWGRDPWQFSSFFHLSSLALVLPYPSTFAFALALGTLAIFPRLVARGTLAATALVVPVMAVLWIFHPVNGLFLWLGLLVSTLETPRPRRQWVGLAVAFVASLALAFAWPLFSVADLWFKQLGVVHEGNDVMYDNPLPRIVPALLGVPWLLVRFRRNRRDPLALFALALAGLVVFGGLSGQWSFGRLISHTVFLLQVALADAMVEFEERLSRTHATPLLRLAVAPAVTALLVGAWSGKLTPMMEKAWTGGDLAWLSFLGKTVDRYDVVLTDLETSWYVPSFSGKVVAFPMQIPFVPDHSERIEAVERFFGPQASQSERIEIARKYGVTHLLFPKGDFDDWQARLKELMPLGRVVYSNQDYVLLRIFPEPREPPAASRPRASAGRT
jgi:hypothetical protein